MGDSTDKPASLGDRLVQLRTKVLNSPMASYELNNQTTGKGVGKVSRSPDAEKL